MQRQPSQATPNHVAGGCHFLYPHLHRLSVAAVQSRHNAAVQHGVVAAVVVRILLGGQPCHRQVPDVPLMPTHHG
jgi:hypothetical protein